MIRSGAIKCYAFLHSTPRQFTQLPSSSMSLNIRSVESPNFALLIFIKPVVSNPPSARQIVVSKDYDILAIWRSQ